MDNTMFDPINGEGSLPPEDTRNTATLGCTLEEYSKTKGLPISFLQSVGVSESKLGGATVLKILYFDTTGNEACVRYRTALAGDKKFMWRKGSKPCLYGLNRLPEITKAEYVILCEGESDAQTLWLQGFPALGIAGAANWKEDRDAKILSSVPTIYIVIEPDNGGDTVIKWLSRSIIRGRVKLLRLPKKDPSQLYLDNQQGFKKAMQEAMASAESWTDYFAKYIAEEGKRAWTACKTLAEIPDILSCFEERFQAAGVIGEERNGKIIFLAIVSRLLDRPISVAVKGPSSGGKSHTVETALRFFPDSAYYALSAMSDRVLAYSEEPLSHRMLVIYEAAGMAGDMATYLIRTLLSEGCIRYETVEKTKDGMRPRLIVREGPTGLIVTTTLTSLHPENETRLLSLQVTDSAEQTKAVFKRIAEGRTDRAVDFSFWHALQTWLECGEKRVFIPYSDTLAEKVPPVAVRLRRDFRQLLILIESHALLHRATRKTDVEGRIIAEVKDYAAVYDLILDILSEGVESSVKANVRETVETVARLLSAGKDHVSIQAIAKQLKLDKGPVSRRVREAVDKGYLINEQTKKGQPAQIKIGDNLPEDVRVLPSPEELEVCCGVAVVDWG